MCGVRSMPPYLWHVRPSRLARLQGLPPGAGWAPSDRCCGAGLSWHSWLVLESPCCTSWLIPGGHPPVRFAF